MIKKLSNCLVFAANPHKHWANRLDKNFPIRQKSGKFCTFLFFDFSKNAKLDKKLSSIRQKLDKNLQDFTTFFGKI